jgi:hypothetical protein
MMAFLLSFYAIRMVLTGTTAIARHCQLQKRASDG